MTYPSTAVHTWQFDTRTYEMDRHGYLRQSVWQNYMEETATQASTNFGFTYDWYMNKGQIWVARRHTIQYRAPVRYGDQITGRTWISEGKRVQALREYEFRRATDQVLILRAQTQWAYVDLQAMRPTRIPDEFLQFIAGMPFADTEPITFTLPDGLDQVLDWQAVSTSLRTVLEAEIDAAGHMNNSVYTAWAETAIQSMMTGRGTPLTTPIGTREITYHRPALVDETIQVEVRLIPLPPDRSLFQTTFTNDETGELLCRDQVVYRTV